MNQIQTSPPRTVNVLTEDLRHAQWSVAKVLTMVRVQWHGLLLLHQGRIRDRLGGALAFLTPVSSLRPQGVDLETRALKNLIAKLSEIISELHDLPRVPLEDRKHAMAIIGSARKRLNSYIRLSLF